MATDPVFSFADQPVHLGLGATVVPLTPITGMDWYESYGTQTESDGAEGRLVSMYTFTESWDSWEVHPNGEELVACLDGQVTVHQEVDGVVSTITLSAGEAIVNPPGAWHTADIETSARVLFITAGLGTNHRPR